MRTIGNPRSANRGAPRSHRFPHTPKVYHEMSSAAQTANRYFVQPEYHARSLPGKEGRPNRKEQ